MSEFGKRRLDIAVFVTVSRAVGVGLHAIMHKGGARNVVKGIADVSQLHVRKLPKVPASILGVHRASARWACREIRPKAICAVARSKDKRDVAPAQDCSGGKGRFAAQVDV